MKTNIQHAIQAFSQPDLKTASLDFFKNLGYKSNKTSSLDITSFLPNLNHDKAIVNQWQSSYLLFQLADEDLQNNLDIFSSSNQAIDNTIIQSYLFAAIELNPNLGFYSRTELVKITRAINKASLQPVLLLFKHGDSFTLSVIHRRINKIDNDKDVLEKVTLIKDVRIENTHRAHLDILNDFSFTNLKTKPTNFVELHNAWQKVLNTKTLNKQFYEKLFDWYLFALPQVKFPQIRAEADLILDEQHQSESLIRLLTRLLFVWFMKEKGLINAELFEPTALKTMLKNFTGENSDDTIYYKAILQNLFFATLNMPIDKRKVIYEGFAPKDYGNQLVYRYADLFKAENFVEHFDNIPFLNGGLFDCLDQKKTDHSAEIRLDGFSTQVKKQAIAPDKLFFGEYKNVDLSAAYDNKKKNKVTVYGLISILQSYKFTVEENTPLEEDIALDPELLGQVFENLLAAYNPETGTTARKQTGSFYTPREIVDYMVDESLIAYFSGAQALLALASGACTPALRLLLSYENTQNPFDVPQTELLINAIDNLKILDPACGSGAFPMGILHKLVFVLSKLDPKNELWRDRQIAKLKTIDDSACREKATQVINDAFDNNELDYGRKLFLIENCIHGVDIQPIATQISKLRFFISLIVDQKSDKSKPNFGIRPLPNLDFKIIAANTLIAAPQDDFDNNALFSNDSFFENFSDLTHDYFNVANPDDKRKCRDKIETLINLKCAEKIKAIESLSHNKIKNKKIIDHAENDVKLWQSYARLFKHEAVAFFEPRYFFPQLIEGFDIVIGNPPYVDSREIPTETARNLKNYKSNIKSQRPNLYIYFIEKSYELLKEKGILTFINPSQFLVIDSGLGLRKLLLRDTAISFVVDVSYVKVFEEAATYTVVWSFVKDNLPEYEIRINKCLDLNELDNTSFCITKKEILKNNKVMIPLNKDFAIISKIEGEHQTLANFGKMAWGTSQAGYGKLKILKEQYDCLSEFEKEKYKPILQTRDIKSFFIDWKNEYIEKRIYSERIVNEFNKPKILIARVTKKLQVAFDDECRFVGKSTLLTNFEGHQNYLLSILNSTLINFWYRSKFESTHMAGGYLRFDIPYLEQIPIPKIPETEQQPFITLVNKILADKKADNDTRALEREIDELVYALYGLSEEEILIVEGK